MDIKEAIKQINLTRKEENELLEFKDGVESVMKHVKIVYDVALENKLDESISASMAYSFFNSSINNK